MSTWPRWIVRKWNVRRLAPEGHVVSLLSRLLGRERRESYTEQTINLRVAQASSRDVRAALTGSLESAAGIVSRAMVSADVRETSLLAPSVLRDVARDLIRVGESVWRLHVTPAGEQSIIRASWWDVRGVDADPSRWWYWMHMVGPDGSTTVRAGADSVFHFRYATVPERPWEGIPPLRWAASLGRLSGTLEAALGDEAETVNVTTVAVPNGTGKEATDAIRAGLAAASGRLALPETTAAGHGDGMNSAPRADWMPRRIGPEYSEHEVTLAAHVGAEVMITCGVPPILADAKAPAGGAREGWRQLLLGTVQPLARLIAEEAGRVLEQPVELVFHELAAADIAARSKGLKMLKDSGVELPRAMELVGW